MDCLDTITSKASFKNFWEAIGSNKKKFLGKEKKKFSPEISDRLVVEVLKRKELLIDNNTSRDLQFSESKRIAWAEVNNIK